MSHSLSMVVLVGAAVLTDGALKGDASPPVDLPTSQTATLGRFARGPVNVAIKVDAALFEQIFAGQLGEEGPGELGVDQFFAQGGDELYVVRVAPQGPLAEALVGDPAGLSGLYALEPLSDLRLLFAPELTLVPMPEFPPTFAGFRAFLERRRIFFILDPPAGLGDASAVVDWAQAAVPLDAAFSATYFPYLNILNDAVPRTIAASSTMAAIYRQNDANDGIWQSPAGAAFQIKAVGLEPPLNSIDSDWLNSNHVNPIREFAPSEIIPFGARTLDRENSDNRFIGPVRTRGWIASSLERRLAFAALEDNAEPLWSQIRNRAEEFLGALFRAGAFQGATPQDAFFVRCDATTTSAEDLAAHRVTLIYGIAFIRPGEFDLNVVRVSTYDPARPVPTPPLKFWAWAGELMLAYPTVAGFNYLLETASDPSPAGWTPYAEPVEGDGAWRRLVIPMQNERAFYRLRIGPTPEENYEWLRR